MSMCSICEDQMAEEGSFICPECQQRQYPVLDYFGKQHWLSFSERVFIELSRKCAEGIADPIINIENRNYYFKDMAGQLIGPFVMESLARQSYKDYAESAIDSA